MKREKIIKILKDYGYSDDTIKSIMAGRRLPSMKRAIEMQKDIPLRIWGDLKTNIK
jgi:hypothetical protein